MRHLFIGGGGLVGNAACNLAQKLSLNWRATTRQDLDLSKQPFIHLPCEVDVVYLIAAMRTPSDCGQAPGLSWRINADAPIELARHYSKTGAFIVFVSSDHVEADSGAYETQKRFAESYINTINAAIIRPGKINLETVPGFAEFMLMIGSHKEAGLYRWKATNPP